MLTGGGGRGEGGQRVVRGMTGLPVGKNLVDINAVKFNKTFFGDFVIKYDPTPTPQSIKVKI
jgi:hypothetical protein